MQNTSITNCIHTSLSKEIQFSVFRAILQEKKNILNNLMKQWDYDCFNPLTPMSDQDRISLYSINTISTR